MNIDTFFKEQYLAICRYCSNTGSYNYWDVEEVASDVILKHYDEYTERCSSVGEVKRWVNRRIMLNLKTRYTDRIQYLRTQELMPSMMDSYVTLDDPADVVCLFQRLPKIPDILLDYEPVQGSKVTEFKDKNRESTRTLVWRAKKKFFESLEAA